MKKLKNRYFLFDVVIPTYNNLTELMHCLAGLERQSMRQFRVLVCVDGSTDGTLEFLSKTPFPFDLDVLCHPGGKRKGPSATRNLCIPHLRSPFVCLLDSDIVPADAFLEKHLEVLSSADVISMGEIVFTNAKSNPAAAYLQRRGRGKHCHGDRISAYYLTTGNAAFRSRYFVESGGLEQNFQFSYGGDDTEFGYRLGKQFHLDIFINKNAKGFVNEKKTVEALLDQMREFGANNLQDIRKKHPEFNALFQMKWFESRSTAARALQWIVKTSLPGKMVRVLPMLPPRLCRGMIHLLVFLNIGKGYLSQKKIDDLRS